MNQKLKTKYLIILILFPIILKLVLAFIIYGHTNDINTFTRITDVLLSGQNPYSFPDLLHWLTYGPSFYLLFIINGIITAKTGLPFHFVIKIFPILAETIISVILFLILNKKYSLKRSFYWSLIFALNPATLSVSAIHGQFDSIPILAMVLSYFFFISDNKKIRNILPAICLGIGASFKYYPLLLLPVLFFKYDKIKEKLSFVAITIALFLITYIPFMISGHFFIAIKRPFEYTPLLNWGIAKFLLLFHRFNISSSPIISIENFLAGYGKLFLFIALIITMLIYSKVSSLGKSYRIIFYCIYTFSFFMHPQYLTWIIPFLFLEINFKELIYLILLTGHIYFLHIIFLIGLSLGFGIRFGTLFSALSFIFGVLTWLFCVYIYFSYVKKDIKNIQFKRIFSLRYWMK